jgi:Zn-dependent protease with chaperone function
MNEGDPIYPGGAFQGDDDSGAVVGQIVVSMFTVRFETEGFMLDLPTQGLEIALDESGERVLFAHANFPGWTVYSLDPSILNHRSFQQQWLKAQVNRLKAEQPEATKHAQRVYVALGAIALILIGLWAVTNAIVSVIVNMLPSEWEAKVGKEAFAEIRQFVPLTDEAALTNRVFLVAQRLNKGLPSDAPKFRFHVSPMPIVNAIALPGGDVIVLEGLLADATPDELAAVLAHEMAHVIKKHAMRQIAQQAGPEFVAKYIFGGDGALSALMAGASTLGELQYSRGNERQADAVAFEILVKANIDPRSLASFFKKIRKIEKKMGEDNDDLFSTHPPTADRINFLERKWEDCPKKSGFEPVNGGAPLPEKTKAFHL